MYTDTGASKAPSTEVIAACEKRLQALAKMETPDDFRHEARKLLREYPDYIDRIVGIARMIGMDSSPVKRGRGGERLVRELQGLRAALVSRQFEDMKRSSIVERNFPDK